MKELRRRVYKWYRSLLREEIGPNLLDDYLLDVTFKTMDDEHLWGTTLLALPQRGDNIYLEIKDRWYKIKDVFWVFTPEEFLCQHVIYYLDPLDIENG